MIFSGMVELLFYTFAAFGFCWGVGGSTLTRPVRESIAKTAQRTRDDGLSFEPFVLSALLQLAECPACLGFWTGIACGAALAGWHFRLSIIAVGFYTAGVNYVIGRLTGLIAEP